MASVRKTRPGENREPRTAPRRRREMVVKTRTAAPAGSAPSVSGGAWGGASVRPARGAPRRAAAGRPGRRRETRGRGPRPSGSAGGKAGTRSGRFLWRVGVGFPVSGLLRSPPHLPAPTRLPLRSLTLRPGAVRAPRGGASRSVAPTGRAPAMGWQSPSRCPRNVGADSLPAALGRSQDPQLAKVPFSRGKGG